jgi:hypothetical protein
MDPMSWEMTLQLSKLRTEGLLLVLATRPPVNRSYMTAFGSIPQARCSRRYFHARLGCSLPSAPAQEYTALVQDPATRRLELSPRCATARGAGWCAHAAAARAAQAG